jgi:hypothetical protein
MITFGTNDQNLGDRASAMGSPSRGVADCYADCDFVIANNGAHGAMKGLKYPAMLLMHSVESSVTLINGLTLVVTALSLPYYKAPILFQVLKAWSSTPV